MPRKAFSLPLRDRDGNVSVEFAIAAIFLVVFALGIYDFGRIGIEVARLNSAARAGAQFVVEDQANVTDTTGIIQAVRNDADDSGQALTVTTQNYCNCPSGGAASCTDTCSDGFYPEMYVEVDVQHQVSLLIDYPGVSQTFPLSASAKVRVR